MSSLVKREQNLLKLSIGMTLFISFSSIFFGIWMKSSSLTFDGFYNLSDAIITLVSLLTMKMIVKGENDRFQYGMWHVEPLLIFINGLILGITCIYAFVNGLTELFAGGTQSAFGPGAVFAGIAFVLSLFMYFYVKKEGRAIQSDILSTDARAWLVGGILNATLFVSFLVGSLMQETSYAHLTPYVDPFVLAIGSLFLLPFPLFTLFSSAKEILQIAPEELSEKVNVIAANVAKKYGFVDYKSHVAKAGRQQFIEIGLVSASGEITKSFGELDLIREEIAREMGNLGPGYWLTVDFTADRRWI